MKNLPVRGKIATKLITKIKLIPVKNPTTKLTLTEVSSKTFVKHRFK